MNEMKVSGKVKLTYFDEKVKNSGARPEVYFDCFGNAVHISPGNTGTVRRVKREFIVDESSAKETPAKKDAEDGEKQEQPKGTNKERGGKSKG